MGNNITKTDFGSVKEDLHENSALNCETDPVISSLPENLRSCISTPSELLSLEDAVSIKTDSSSTTEYESASENDISPNQQSSCNTLNITSAVDNSSSYNKHFEAQVRNNILSVNTISDKSFFTITYDENQFPNVNHCSLSDEKKEQLLEVRSSQMDLIRFSNFLEDDKCINKAPIKENNEQFCSESKILRNSVKYKKLCSEESKIARLNKSISFVNILNRKKNGICRNVDNYVINHTSIANIYRSNNFTVFTKIQDAEKLLCRDKLFMAQMKITRRPFKILKQGIKTPITSYKYKNKYFVVRKLRKYIPSSCTALLNYNVRNVFCNVMDKTCDILCLTTEMEEIASYNNKDKSYYQELVPLCKLTFYLNLRCCYSSFYKFKSSNVLACYMNGVQQVTESLIMNFISNRWVYCTYLNFITFYLICNEFDLCYAIYVPNEQMYSQWIEIHNISSSSDMNDCPSKENVLILKNMENAKYWKNLSNKAANSNYEIIKYFLQLECINSEVMNSNENVSEAGPATAADFSNINNVPFLNESALDYLSKGSGTVAENLRKQSLYVKFDPLVAPETSSTTINGDETFKFNDSTTYGSNDVKINVKNSIQDDLNSTVLVTDSHKNEEYDNVGSLISLTPNKSPKKITPKSSPRYSDIDPDDESKLKSLLLKSMKKEETYKEEIESLKRDNENALQKLQNAEKEISQLKSQLEAVQENEKKLKNELKERMKSKQQLSMIMDEYEKTISKMVSQREEENKEFERKIKKAEDERDSTVQHLNNLENAFNDIHQKYERGKAVNEALKKNEDALKKSLKEYEVTVKTVENKYELLKSHATSQLEKANQELELITQSYEKEQAKLKAMLKKAEIQINSQQNALERKTKENQEMASICDELITKLSTHSSA